MTGLIATLGAIVGSKVVDKATERTIDDGDLKRLRRMYGPTNSIAKMAKGAISVYPVLMSNMLLVSGDAKMGFAISKELETQFAVFTLLSIGLRPRLEKGVQPADHLLQFSTESADSDEFHKGPTITLENITAEETERFVEALKAHPDLFEVYTTSCESARDPNDGNPYTLLFHDEKREAELDKREDSLKEKEFKLREARSKQAKDFGRIEKELSAVAPTLVNVNLKTDAGECKVTIGVKANVHMITNEETLHILSKAIDNKPFINFIKLTTGEKTLFSDILLQTKRAQKDKELADKLGRHPWYRTMESRSLNKKIKNFFNLISRGNMFASDTLPIYSMVCTKVELENSLALPYKALLRNNAEKLKKLMEKTMMIALVVYDTELETVDFLINGFERFETVSVSDLKRRGKSDSTEDMSKIIAELAKKV